MIIISVIAILFIPPSEGISVSIICPWELQQGEKSFNEAFSHMSPSELTEEFYYSVLGDCANDINNYEEALEYYDTALLINPNNIRVLENKFAMLFYLELYNEALEINDAVLRLDPNNDDAFNSRGEIYEKLGDPLEANIWIDQANG